MEQQPGFSITAPEAELSALSFCEPNAPALRAWIGSLPMANTAEAATQLRQATFEVARLQCDFVTRMMLLEELRPTLHYLCARLDRTAATSSNHSDAIARLTQRLQTNLCSGYKAVILAALETPEAENATERLSLAVHRALSDLSRTLLRTLQFYVAPADRLWLELNQLYLLAEQMALDTARWEDTENHSQTTTTTAEAYARSLLLAICKPNQLRHGQLNQIFNAIENWSPSISIDRDTTDALFFVDLTSEKGPRYSKLLEQAGAARGVHTEVLVYELEAYLKELDSNIQVPEYVDEALLSHLVDSWGMMQARAFKRFPASGSIKVCIGLRTAHYYLSGGVDFVDQLEATDAMLQREVNPFMADDHGSALEAVANKHTSKDVWDDAFDLRVKIPVNPEIIDPDRILLQGYGRDNAEANSASKDVTAQFYDTTALDTSPGGYRIRWNEPLPPNVQTGEVVAIRESEDPRWSIAIIRWIRQDSDGTSMGIELISPRAIPVAVRVINKRGGPSDFARALLLPALEPIDQPATLITPLVPYQTAQKIHIHRQGVQTTAQLSQCTLKTQSVRQFTFRMLDGYLENTQVNIKLTAQSAAGSLDTGDS
jgi:hypothetical protein